MTSGGRTGLEELEHLESRLKLEEVAHFRFDAQGMPPRLSSAVLPVWRSGPVSCMSKEGSSTCRVISCASTLGVATRGRLRAAAEGR